MSAIRIQEKTGVGIVKGFGITGGAIASSVSHDSHNLIVIGDNDRDMYLAVQELLRTQGGYTLMQNGKVYDTLPLPVMGLMSDSGYENVNALLGKMIPRAYMKWESNKDLILLSLCPLWRFRLFLKSG